MNRPYLALLLCALLTVASAGAVLACEASVDDNLCAATETFDPRTAECIPLADA